MGSFFRSRANQRVLRFQVLLAFEAANFVVYNGMSIAAVGSSGRSMASLIAVAWGRIAGGTWLDFVVR